VLKTKLGHIKSKVLPESLGTNAVSAHLLLNFSLRDSTNRRTSVGGG